MKRTKIRTIEEYNEVVRQLRNIASFINSSYNFEACKVEMNEFLLCKFRLLECEDLFEYDDEGNAIEFLG